MGIFLGDTAPSKIFVGDTAVSKVFVGDTKVRPKEYPYLCFTANTAGSTLYINKFGSPSIISLEKSTDGENRSDYNLGTIQLSNVGDKVYMRNKSETPTGFTTGYTNNYYRFVMTGSIAASGDIMYLLCKNSTNSTVGQYCFQGLFSGCTSLTSTPRIPATTLTNNCYGNMFLGCSNLETLAELPALWLTTSCYGNMFRNCPKIKLSATQTGEYQTPYRIPTTGTGSTGTQSLTYMFYGTGGTWNGNNGTPTINTTYYTSNAVI